MPTKNAEAKRKHYEANKEAIIHKQFLRRQATAQFFAEVKAGKCCIDCGEDFPACLDYHHLDPNQKAARVQDMRRDAWSPERIMEELAKCVLLCANCHRKRHFIEQSGPYRHLQARTN